MFVEEAAGGVHAACAQAVDVVQDQLGEVVADAQTTVLGPCPGEFQNLVGDACTYL
ncbi:hypothetical protein AB5J56_01720 [Streptomyces sp. R21]|uniref:Uncharacterized protein n=1 Tax=Streptomyces sp. R21 TaxID=3238627 RepID=A0AB39NXT5_9ACTN